MSQASELIEKYGIPHYVGGIFRIITFLGPVNREQLAACCYYIDRCSEKQSAYAIPYFHWEYQKSPTTISIPHLDEFLAKLPTLTIDQEGNINMEVTDANLYLGGTASEVIDLALTNINELKIAANLDALVDFALHSDISKYASDKWIDEYKQKCEF